MSDHASKETEIVHEYDGIIEHDNALPRWWLYSLYGTIVFAVFYWMSYEVLGSLPSTTAEFDAAASAKRAAEAEALRAAGPATDVTLTKLSEDGATVAAGKAVFEQSCAACHKPDGSGQIGPNLTDQAWLHGGRPEQIYATVKNGVPKNGMQAWGGQLGEEKTRSVVAYVLTMKGKNLPGKAPQGTLE